VCVAVGVAVGVAVCVAKCCSVLQHVLQCAVAVCSVQCVLAVDLPMGGIRCCSGVAVCVTLCVPVCVAKYCMCRLFLLATHIFEGFKVVHRV